MQYKRSKILSNAISITDITAELGGSADITDLRFGIETSFKYDQNSNIVDSTVFYWDTSWKVSDRTFANLSTLTDLNANLSSCPLPQPYSDFRVFATLDETLHTPSTTLVDFEVEFKEDNVVQDVGCKVIVEVGTGGGGNSRGILVKGQLTDTNGEVIKWRDRILEPTVKEVYTNSEGVAYLELAPNSEFNVANTHWQITIGTNAAEKYTIPANTASINLTDLTPQ